MSQIISLSKTLKPTTQTQKPSHRIQNRQNNMKHIELNTYIICTQIHTNRTQLNKLKPIAQFPQGKKKIQIDSTKLNYRYKEKHS